MGWLGFLLGLWTGSIFTALTIAVLKAGRETDDAFAREFEIQEGTDGSRG